MRRPTTDEGKKTPNNEKNRIYMSRYENISLKDFTATTVLFRFFFYFFFCFLSPVLFHLAVGGCWLIVIFFLFAGWLTGSLSVLSFTSSLSYARTEFCVLCVL